MATLSQNFGIIFKDTFQQQRLTTIRNMMASFFQMNTASTSGGLVLDGPSVPMPPPFINQEEGERAEETLTDPELAEYTIKVPPPLV
ncbi:hypothetical protein Tco_0244219 [Tanacetum coccineum]